MNRTRLFGTPIPYALTTALLSLLVVGLDLLDNTFGDDCRVSSGGPCPLEWWRFTDTFLSAFIALNLPAQSILAFRETPLVRRRLVGYTAVVALLALAIPMIAFAENAHDEACRYVGRGDWHVFVHDGRPCVPRFFLLLYYLWAITALNLPVHGPALLYVMARKIAARVDDYRQSKRK